MNCKECLLNLDDYIEGELDARTAGLVSAHISVCAACAREFEELNLEQNVYARYLLDVEASPTLWNGLSVGIEKTKSAQARGLFMRWREVLTSAFVSKQLKLSFAAAMALILIAAAISIMRYRQWHATTLESQAPEVGDGISAVNRKGQPEASASKGVAISRPEGNGANKVTDSAGSGQAAKLAYGGRRISYPLASRPKKNDKPMDSAPAIVRASVSPGEVVFKAEQDYQAAIATVSRQINEHRPESNSDALARFEDTISAIDRLIDETRQALRSSPNDPIIAQHMLTAYAEKLEALRRIASERRLESKTPF
jgi:antitoxin component HigA of HigAB toxin-antitoxin module